MENVEIVDFDVAYNHNGTPSDEVAPRVVWDSQERRATTEPGWNVWRAFEPYEVVEDADLWKFGREHGTVWAIVPVEDDVEIGLDTDLGWSIVVRDVSHEADE